MIIAFPIIVGWIVLGALFGPDDKPHEGDRCGPHHHWVYIPTNATGPDLSCEDTGEAVELDIEMDDPRATIGGD